MVTICKQLNIYFSSDRIEKTLVTQWHGYQEKMINLGKNISRPSKQEDMKAEGRMKEGKQEKTGKQLRNGKKSRLIDGL